MVVDDLLAVENHRDVFIYQSDVHCLPFADRFFCGDRRRDSTVNSPHIVRVEWSAVAFKHQNFINPAQVDSAVAVLQRAGFKRQPEVLKFSFSADVRVWLSLATFVLGSVAQHAIFDTPSHYSLGVQRFPSRQVLAVEKFN